MENSQWKQVFETTDYDKFKLMPGNREIKKAAVKRKKEEMQKVGQLTPILVSPVYEVYDGQHRLMAAKELQIPVVYEVVYNWGPEQVVSMNRSQKNWRPEDYAHAGATKQGEEQEDYKKLVELNQLFPFKLPQIAQIAGQYSTRQKAMKHVQATVSSEKNGECFAFVISYNAVKNLLSKLNEIGNYFSGYSDAQFVDAIFKAMKHPSFDLEQFVYKLSMQYGKLNRASSPKYHLPQIEEIYNYKRTKLNRIKLSNIK